VSDDAITDRRLDHEMKDAVCLTSRRRGPTSPELGDPPLDLAVGDRPDRPAAELGQDVGAQDRFIPGSGGRLVGLCRQNVDGIGFELDLPGVRIDEGSPRLHGPQFGREAARVLACLERLGAESGLPRQSVPHTPADQVPRDRYLVDGRHLSRTDPQARAATCPKHPSAPANGRPPDSLVALPRRALGRPTPWRCPGWLRLQPRSNTCATSQPA